MNKRPFVPLLLVLAWISITPCAAQSSFVDSLLSLIEKAKTPKEKIRQWDAVLAYTSRNQPEKTTTLANKAIAYAASVNDSIAIANFIRITGTMHNTVGQRDSALFYYYNSIAILERLGEEETLASLYNDVGRLNRRDNPDRAIGYYDKAMAIYTRNNDLAGIALIHNESGVAFENKGDYAEAEKRYRQSLLLNQQLNDSVGISYSLSFLSGVYAAQKKYTEAEPLALQVLAIRQALKDSFALSIAYTNLGEFYNLTGDYKKAIGYFEQSNGIAAAITFLDILSHNYGQLSEASAQLGDYKAALSYKNQQTQISDSIFQVSKAKQIEELSTKYATAEKEKQIQQQEFELSQKNYLLTTIAALALAGAAFAFWFLKRRQYMHRQQLEKERRLQQEQATRAVMEAEERERRRIAGELHDGVGQLLSAARMNMAALDSDLSTIDIATRHKLQTAIDMVDEGCREVRTVSHSMVPNALLKRGLGAAISDFVERIDPSAILATVYTEGLDERLDEGTESMLYRIVQECVNNTIKHSQAGKLDISLIKDADGLQLMVEDDGVGFNLADSAEGIGLQNIESRVKYLQGTLEIDSSPGKGTVLAIHIPPQSFNLPS